MQSSQSSVKDAGFRLSYQQRRHWQHLSSTKNGRGSTVLNAQCALRIEGPVHVRRLRQALEGVIARHEILRTTFCFPAGLHVPVQVVERCGQIQWRDDELTPCAPDIRTARVEQLSAEDLREGFKLAEGPRLRASLLVLKRNEHVLVVTLPSLCADAASLQNLTHELAEAYSSDAAEAQDVIQHAQLAEWEQSLQNGEDAEQAKAYWLARRSAPSLALPLQKTSRSTEFHPVSCDVAITAQIASRLDSVERQDALLLACWVALLGRVSGQSVVRVGLTCPGRGYEELQGVLGPVARVVPLVYRFEDGLRFRELTTALADLVDEAGDWQDSYERGDQEPPFETAGFEMSEWPCEIPAEGIRFRLISEESWADRVHIKLSVTRAGDEVRARLHYDPQVFAPEYVERLGGQLCTLLDAALADPDTTVEQLSVLSDGERNFLIRECNDTRSAYRTDACLHQLFSEQAARTPDRTAVSFEGASLTYAELNRRANQLAHRLRVLQIGPEVRVGVLLHRSIEMMVGLLGILKAGAAYVPLEATYPAERLAFMLADSAVSVLLTERQLRHLIPSDTAMTTLCLDLPFEEVVGDQPTYEPETGVRPENLAYTLYTSGSTGKPKGTLVTHRSLVNYLGWCSEAYDVAAGTGTPVHSSIGFDATITALFPALLAGRTVEFVRESDGVESLTQAMLRSEGFSLVKITPAHLSLLNEVAQSSELTGKTRAFVIGGDALSSARLSVWRQHSPQTRLINEYGPTETVVGCCIHEVSETDLADDAVPIGRPIANTQLYVLDSGLSPLPSGIPGELFIGGDGVSRGYLGRPGLTAERFLPDPFSSNPGARVYRTGDLTVQMPDGVLRFLGRLDHQVKIRSYRIELGEIEAHIEQHPGVAQCVVVAREQSNGEKSLVAYVQPSGSGPSAEELRAYLLSKVPDHMVPAVFVTLEALPLTAHGKVDRKALPAPETVRPARRAPHVAPRTRSEERLAAIFRDVLKLDQIGIHDDFFLSGGDSIMSILVVARAVKAGLRFTTRDLFQNPTIAGLAAVATDIAASTADQSAVEGLVPLTPIQHWFFERQLAQPHQFDQAVLLHLQPRIDGDLVRRSLEQLVEQHDALRLRFTRNGANWRQTHGPSEGVLVYSEVDLADLSAAGQQTTMQAKADEAQSGLNIGEGPVMRAVLFRFGGSKAAKLLLVIHHLVVDGVSWRILIDDFATVYRQLAVGQEAALPEKTTSFRDWAIRLQDYGRTEALKAESDYWLRRPTPSIALPVDFAPRCDTNTTASTDRLRIHLDPMHTPEILQKASEAYRTNLEDLLLTALVRACAHWSGSGSLLVDLEGHGREDLFEGVDLSRTVGWFTSIFPVHLELTSAGPIEDLKAIKEKLRSVPRRGIGFGLLRYLSPLQAELASLPPAQVSFNYLGHVEGLAVAPILRVEDEGVGAEQGAGNRRLYLLDVLARIANGRLQIDLVYSRAVYRRETMEALGKEIRTQLESLVTHCLSPGTAGFTPSDFPEAGLNQEELDRLVADLD